MARYLVLKDGVVDNVVEWDPDYPESRGWVMMPADEEVRLGWELKPDGSFGPIAAANLPLLTEVTQIHFRSALRALGKRDKFEIAMKQLGDEAWDNWVYGASIRRNDLFVTQAATAAGIKQADFEEIFKVKG